MRLSAMLKFPYQKSVRYGTILIKKKRNNTAKGDPPHDPTILNPALRSAAVRV